MLLNPDGEEAYLLPVYKILNSNSKFLGNVLYGTSSLYYSATHHSNSNSVKKSLSH